MSILRKTIAFTLFFLPGIINSAQADVDETMFGYTEVIRFNAFGWSGAQFSVKAPFYPIENALISMTLNIKMVDGKMPENVTCNLQRDFRHVPADLHAVPGEDNGLGLSFERLEPDTLIHFLVLWKKKDTKAIPHSGTIRASGPDWKYNTERKFGSFARDNSGTPVQILITGPNDCRLM